MKHIAISCGGTGGHLAPGIAVAQEFVRRGYRVNLFISQKNVDTRLAMDYGELQFITLAGSGFSLRPISLFKFLFNLIKAFGKFWRFTGKNRVDALIAFGGFSSIGTALVSFFHRKPIFLHEANLQLGKAIRCLAPLAQKVYIPNALKETKRFRKKQKFISMGYPIRRDFHPIPMEDARRAISLPLHGKCVLICGGSQGAKPLNDWVKAHEFTLTFMGYHVICLTGLGGEDREITCAHGENFSHVVRYCAFHSHMHWLYSAADFAISRAGAGTIAELIQCETPSVLIPYPFSTANHQWKNAKAMADGGMAFLLEQENMEKLLPLIRRWNEGTLQSMRRNLHHKKQMESDVTKILVDDITSHLE
ncbi:MAG: UDP-N-acetylglucosamine--N-acetylmuramyl-(pentapeptide) pyrophosphoryl-undecaprenol N-acetylglucosamine transferase [Puniceicoccales bacterium]|jgi:UDP-N-acetylglucosamine--N-acetylmuramyl-(pentapeptide) pyrophosphoryl-undecaprenol N-acetylglucosamine transferase|nr:UDP-N-acetylglucosamine--N-acetylmuramyl-(pentapeptide) pyrophosphoryl-undecaprenol N-acetylglucosamine transferase [Puniceicoccales bacterium]